MMGRRGTKWAGWTLLLGLACVLLALAAGCTEEPSRIEMTRVPLPQGGSVMTVDRVDEDTLIAASGSTLYVREDGNQRWDPREIRWPGRINQPGYGPLSSVRRASQPANIPTNHLLTTHNGRIWMLARPDHGQPAELLVSQDAGRNWHSVELPRVYGEARRKATGGQLNNADARLPMRLLDRGERGLYLIDGRHLWRAKFGNDGSDGSEDGGGAVDGAQPGGERQLVSGWKLIDVSEVTAREEARRRELPRVVRNYLPSSETRPFDLLTVFGDRLYIYRRHVNSTRWVLVSTLPTIDRSLHGVSGRDVVYLVSPDAVYRSSEFGEQWQRLALADPLSTPPKLNAFTLLPPAPQKDASGDEQTDDDERPNARRQKPPALAAGTRSGAILLSEDGGDTWITVRDADPDDRAVTRLLPGAAPSEIWASTAGLGILQTIDRGDTWGQANHGLRAAHPYDVTIGANGEFLVGTDSGLFRLTGAPEAGNWDRFHDRAATTVFFNESSSRIFTGTRGGAIVTKSGGGELMVSEVGSPDGGDAPLFQPWQTSDAIQNSTAVLAIRHRPNSADMYAWTREAGMLTSSDNGNSWRHAPLNQALLSALDRSVITNFLVDDGERMYLASHGFELNTPSQLWHSYNNGETWHAVYTFPSTQARHPLLLRRDGTHATETLFMAHSDRLARSRNAGNSWKNLEGPWQNGTIRTYNVDETRQALIYNDNHASRIVFITDVLQDLPTSRAYTLIWPGNRIVPDPNLRKLVTFDRFIYLLGDRSIYAGAIPEGDAQLPHAPTIIAVLIFLLILTGLSFWFLRFE